MIDDIFVGGCVKSIQTLLPATVDFDPDLNAAEDHFLATFEVDAELHQISVANGERARLHSGAGEADMVEEGAGARFDVFYVPLAVGLPEFAVLA